MFPHIAHLAPLRHFQGNYFNWFSLLKHLRYIINTPYKGCMREISRETNEFRILYLLSNIIYVKLSISRILPFIRIDSYIPLLFDNIMYLGQIQHL